MSQNNFQRWFTFDINDELTDKGFYSGEGSYGKAYLYFKENIKGPTSSEGIWEFANDLTPKIYQIGNITIEGTNGKIVKQIKKDEIKILKSLANFTNKVYSNIELEVQIGRQ